MKKEHSTITFHVRNSVSARSRGRDRAPLPHESGASTDEHVPDATESFARFSRSGCLQDRCFAVRPHQAERKNRLPLIAKPSLSRHRIPVPLEPSCKICKVRGPSRGSPARRDEGVVLLNRHDHGDLSTLLVDDISRMRLRCHLLVAPSLQNTPTQRPDRGRDVLEDLLHRPPRTVLVLTMADTPRWDTAPTSGARRSAMRTRR